MERERYFELLQQRLTLLDNLAGALQSSNQALVRLDLETIHQQVGEQERLCREIQVLDRGLDDVQRKCGIGLESGSEDVALGRVLGRVAKAQAEVRALNRRHAALVRRSRRTLEAMLHFVRSTSLTYSDPRLVRSSAGGRE
jgi:hypothetical protein